MDNNILGLALSFSFLALIILVGIILKRYASISSEAMRKFVHIGVSNWWFIEVQFFTSLSFAVTGPILFIILNSLFTFLDWGKSLGMDDKRRNYGLIYFPVTLLLLVILQYQGVVSTLVCSIAVFVMGYGDGLAALVGSKWGKKKLPVPGMIKSWAGTLTMLLSVHWSLSSDWAFSLRSHFPLSWGYPWWLGSLQQQRRHLPRLAWTILQSPFRQY